MTFSYAVGLVEQHLSAVACVAAGDMKNQEIGSWSKILVLDYYEADDADLVQCLKLVTQAWIGCLALNSNCSKDVAYFIASLTFWLKLDIFGITKFSYIKKCSNYK